MEHTPLVDLLPVCHLVIGYFFLAGLIAGPALLLLCLACFSAPHNFVSALAALHSELVMLVCWMRMAPLFHAFVDSS